MSTRTASGHGDGSTVSSSSASRWSELPDDLLGMIRVRIDFLCDLARMASVCKPWRDAASRLPTTHAVPALILSPGGRSKKKHLCGPDGSWAMRIPSKAANKRFVGSYQGGWIAATDDHHELVIVNLFSGAEVVLSAKQSVIASIPSTTMDSSENGIKKIVFSDDPASSNGCTLAALRVRPDGTSVISVCRVGCPDGGFRFA